jgi:hypothetical protein
MQGTGRSKAEVEQIAKLVNILIEAGYIDYRLGGFRGPTSEVSATDSSLAKNFIQKCVGGRPRKKAQCNRWWIPESQSDTVSFSAV